MFLENIGLRNTATGEKKPLGKMISMVDIEDETTLITPNNKLKKDNLRDNIIVNKIFGSFIANKEDK